MAQMVCIVLKADMHHLHSSPAPSPDKSQPAGAMSASYCSDPNSPISLIDANSVPKTKIQALHTTSLIAKRDVLHSSSSRELRGETGAGQRAEPRDERQRMAAKVKGAACPTNRRGRGDSPAQRRSILGEGGIRSSSRPADQFLLPPAHADNVVFRAFGGVHVKGGVLRKTTVLTGTTANAIRASNGRADMARDIGSEKH